MEWFKKLERWRATTKGLIVFTLLQLSLAYVFFYWATDTGSLLDWFLMFALLIGGGQDLIRLIGKVSHRG